MNKRGKRVGGRPRFKREVSELQARIRSLPSDEAIFSIIGPKNEDIVPLSRAKALVISRGDYPRTYVPLQLRGMLPCVVSLLPVVWEAIQRTKEDGSIETSYKAHIGGPGWYEYRKGKHHSLYAREHIRGYQPCGTEIDLFETDPREPRCPRWGLKDERIFLRSNKVKIDRVEQRVHKKMVQHAGRMLDPIKLEDMPGYDVNGFGELRMPDLLFVPSKQPLRLNYDTIDDVVLTAVNMGLWGVRDHDVFLRGLQAPQRGVVTREQGSNDYTFRPDEDPDDDEEVIYYHRHICSDVELRCRQLFHLPVRAELRPTLPPGEHRVARGHVLYAPQMPADTFKDVDALKKSVGQGVLNMYRFIAALTRARMVNNLPALDSDVAVGGGEPYLDLDSMIPRVQKLVGSPISLVYRQGFWNVNLSDFQGRRSNRLLSEELREERAVRRKARESKLKEKPLPEPAKKLAAAREEVQKAAAKEKKAKEKAYSYTTFSAAGLPIDQGTVMASDKKEARKKVRELLQVDKLPKGTVVEKAKEAAVS